MKYQHDLCSVDLPAVGPAAAAAAEDDDDDCVSLLGTADGDSC